MHKWLLFLFLIIMPSFAIEIRPVDDSSAFCNNIDCIVSIKYMNNISQRAEAQQAIIDSLYLENRDLKQQGIKTPYEQNSPEARNRTLKEVWIINQALANKVAACENR